MPPQSTAQSRLPERYLYDTMLQRCYNPRKMHYDRYGGRGIVVCERWRVSFDAFLADMGRRPGPGYSLDRIDNDGPYSPENCRWATRQEQARNRTSNRRLTHNGVTRTLQEWAEATGIGRAVIGARLDKLGWDIAKALGTPTLTFVEVGRLGKGKKHVRKKK